MDPGVARWALTPCYYLERLQRSFALRAHCGQHGSPAGLPAVPRCALIPVIILNAFGVHCRLDACAPRGWASVTAARHLGWV